FLEQFMSLPFFDLSSKAPFFPFEHQKPPVRKTLLVLKLCSDPKGRKVKRSSAGLAARRILLAIGDVCSRTHKGARSKVAIKNRCSASSGTAANERLLTQAIAACGQTCQDNGKGGEFENC